MDCAPEPSKDDQLTDPSGAVGPVLASPTRLLGVQPFGVELISGLQETPAQRGGAIIAGGGGPQRKSEPPITRHETARGSEKATR